MSWSCSICTFLNQDNDVRCAICNTANGPIQTWACAACTFADNPNCATICSVCETPRITRTTSCETPIIHCTTSQASHTSHTDNASQSQDDEQDEHEDEDGDVEFEELDPTESSQPLSTHLPSSLRKRLSRTMSSSSTPNMDTVSDKDLPMFSMNFHTICTIHKKLSGAHTTTTTSTTNTTITSTPIEKTKSGGLLSKVFGKRGSGSSPSTSTISTSNSNSTSIPTLTPSTPVNLNKGGQDIGTPSDRKQVMRILNDLYQHVEHKEANKKHRAISTCQICYCDFTGDQANQTGDPDDDDVLRVKMTTCGHAMICADCMHQYCWKRIEEETVLPWLPCPAEECSAPVHPSDLHAAGLSTLDLVTMARLVMAKKICRNSNWVCCPTPRCVYGFVEMGKPVQKTLTCELCNQSHEIEKGKMNVDAEMQKLLDNGTLRKCPKCEQITLKEKGICNVIECAKCGIWWNWRTRETGKDSRTLKNLARSRGTLWEPGELRYQQQLEASDPEAFKALLERNGMKYDPNYVRGT